MKDHTQHAASWKHLAGKNVTDYKKASAKNDVERTFANIQQEWNLQYIIRWYRCEPKIGTIKPVQNIFQRFTAKYGKCVVRIQIIV